MADQEYNQLIYVLLHKDTHNIPIEPIQDLLQVSNEAVAHLEMFTANKIFFSENSGVL